MALLWHVLHSINVTKNLQKHPVDLPTTAYQCWSPDIRIIRNSDIFGQFDGPKIDAPNSDIQIVKKTLFLEHFFMIFTFLHGILLLWVLSSIFAPFLLYKKAAKNEEKILLKKIVGIMRNIMMKMMRKMMKIMTI